MTDAPPALAEIAPSEARGEIHDIYEAIAGALGVRLVNLVYRHLATVPGALGWAWGIVGPPFAAGAFAREAATLVEIVRTAAPDMRSVSLAACGIGEADAGSALATLDAYNRANPMNAISLEVISLALAESRAADPLGAASPDNRHLPALLPLRGLDGLPASTTALLGRLAVQATGRDTEIVPSLFRHYLAWPGFLEALSDWLEPLAADDTVGRMSNRIHAAAREAAQRIFEDLPPPGRHAELPDAATRAALGKTVRIFPPAICRMIVIGALLRAALRP